VIDVFSILNAMDQFSELVSKPPVSLLEGACVHDQHKQADCDRCVTACPTHAFDLSDGQLTLSADRCVRCGCCVHACPTGAIVGQTESEKLLKRVAQYTDGSHIELACAYRDTPQTMVDPDAAIFIAPRCLAALSVSSYVELANQGITQVILRTDACIHCPIGQLVEQIHETALAARQLTAAHPTMLIHVIDDLPADAGPARFIHDTNRRTMSRRGLFQMFTHVTEEQETPSPVPEYASNIPLERQRLLAALDARPGAPPAWAPSLTVEGQCSACEVCARICPTDALVMEMGRTQFQLKVNPAYCTGCGLCTAACPEGVLHFDSELIAAVPGEASLMTLTTGELHGCKRCKTTFSGSSDLCPACEFRRKNPFGSSIKMGH
jgi:ferredoxin